MAKQGFTLTADAIRKLRRDHARLANEIRNGSRPRPPQKVGWRDPSPRIRFRNDSGETVPKWAVMRVTGAELTGTTPLIIIGMADADWNSTYVFSSGRAVASGAKGYLQLGPIVRARTNGVDSVSNGQRANPVSGQWHLTIDRSNPAALTGYGMLTLPTATDPHCMGLWQPGPKARWIAFTLNAAMATVDVSVSATVTSYHDGSNPGTPLTVVNGLGFEGEIGAGGYAMHDPETDTYTIWQMVCPEE